MQLSKQKQQNNNNKTERKKGKKSKANKKTTKIKRRYYRFNSGMIHTIRDNDGSLLLDFLLDQSLVVLLLLFSFL